MKKTPGGLDLELLDLCRHGNKIEAVKRYKEVSGLGLKESLEYVNQLEEANGLSSGTKGCFVATACYGDYEAPQVKALRVFRDEKLLTTPAGRILVKWYYAVSPAIARQLEKSEMLKTIVRKNLLDPLVRILR